MKISCIYKITNIKNGKIYIGSTNNYHKRVLGHKNRLKKQKHHSPYLQRSYNKHGKDSFEFSIIEICDQTELLIKEQHYLDTLNPEYNVSKSSSCPMLGRKHSKETLLKFKTRSSISGKEHYMYGKNTPEHIKQKQISARTGLKRTETTKKKMSDTAKRINSISRIDRNISRKKLIDNKGNIYTSLTHAAKTNNISIQTVCDILKGRHTKTRSGVSFKYLDNLL